MSKFIFTKTGAEVKFGDIMSLTYDKETPLGKTKISYQTPLTEENLEYFLVAGIIKEIKHKEPCSIKVPTNLEYYIEKVAKKLGWHYEKTRNYLSNLERINKVALFSILLKEVALEIDKTYEGHISEIPEIYIISTITGTINKIKSSYVKNYKNFAAFRSAEDANLAIMILTPIYKELFKNE